MSHGWDHGLFSCFSAGGTCCLGCCCPCFNYGRVNYRINHPDDPALQNFSLLNVNCLLFYALTQYTGIGGCALQCLQRKEVRDRAGIKGSAGEDCLVAWCCHCCSIIQDDQETKALREGKGIYAAVQPVGQAPMMYGPPV